MCYISTIDAPGSAELYLLSATPTRSDTVSLNGTPLAMGSNDKLPTLMPQRLKRAKVTLPARSIGFIAIPGAGNLQCR